MRCKFSSVDDAWLLSLDISVKKQNKTLVFYRNTITIGELSQTSRPLFNIVYYNSNFC
jgi:hypothetical protein